MNYLAVIAKHQQAAPVNVIQLANELGVRVWSSKSLPDGVSGKLYKDPNLAGSSGYAILVNGSHVETRQRFTIAHEIAHFMLHKDTQGVQEIVDNAFYRSEGLSSAQEIEANQLAAEILMPFSLIKKLCTEKQIARTDAETLAKEFKVSEVAMKIRLGMNF